MSTVILKDQEFSEYSEQTQEANGDLQRIKRLRQIAIGWITSQSSLHSHWRKYNTASAGRQVSYRVWSRHGAYLEVNNQQHRQ